MIAGLGRVIWGAREVHVAGPSSVDLRKRVVEGVENGLTYEDSASQFDVGRASVSRWLALIRKTGSLEPKAMGGSKSKLGETEREVLKFLVSQAPDATQAELADQLEAELGIRVHGTTVSRALKAMGLTRKKSRSSTPVDSTTTSSKRGRPSKPPK